MNAAQIKEILKLSLDDRINLVNLIWESISISPEKIVLHDSQKKELNHRLKDFYENPEEGLSLNELLEELKYDKKS